MVEIQNDLKDLVDKAGPGGIPPPCFVPLAGHEGLDALLLPNMGIQIHAKMDHEPPSDGAIANAMRVRLCIGLHAVTQVQALGQHLVLTYRRYIHIRYNI